MAITDMTGIVNMALLLTGAKRITSIAGSGKSAELANLIAEQKRDECYEMPIDWVFATVRTEALTAHTANPANGTYDYYYAIPTSCARFIAVVDENGDRTQYPYRRELHVDGVTLPPVIACNETSVYVKYIHIVTDITYWPAWFKWLVACRIALTLVEPLKQDKGGLKTKIIMAYQIALDEAKAANAAWDVNTNSQHENTDYGNNDVLDAASDEIDNSLPRIIER